MQLQFERNSLSCLRNVLAEVQNMEQTQEIRIPEGMPGAERVVSAWGQVVMRSKEWHGSGIHLSAGMMVWVLYLGEDGSTQHIPGWIPFQFQWDLPDNCPDGTIRILCLPRYVDARQVSAGRIMVRAGMAAFAEAWCPSEITVYHPAQVPDGVELLKSTYPVRLPKEAGEKQFLVEEELTLPGSAPIPRKLVCCRMDPVVTDRKVLSSKIVFRGDGNLHVLYESETGQMHGWDFELPFSQYAELTQSHSQDAQADVRLMPTNLELEVREDGKFYLKGSLTAQYLVDDREMLELTEDAYSPGRELMVQQEMLSLPALLDGRQEQIHGELTLPIQADIVTDVQFLPDFPTQRSMDGALSLEMPGLVQVLYYGADGTLQSSTGRWAGNMALPVHEDCHFSALPLPGADVQVIPNGDGMSFKASAPVFTHFMSGQGMPMVTGLNLGEILPKKEDRPSLILRRADQGNLWELAKACGTAVEAIRRANNLTGDPMPGQMLLIPMP